MRLNTRFAVVAERCSFGCFRNLARPRAEGWSCLCLGVRILPSAWASCTNAGMRTRMIAHGGCEKMLCCAHGAARITQTSVIRNRDAACACCALRSGICGNDGGLVFVLSPMLASSDSGLASSRNHICAQMIGVGCTRVSCHYALRAAPPQPFPRTFQDCTYTDSDQGEEAGAWQVLCSLPCHRKANAQLSTNTFSCHVVSHLCMRLSFRPGHPWRIHSLSWFADTCPPLLF